MVHLGIETEFTPNQQHMNLTDFMRICTRKRNHKKKKIVLSYACVHMNFIMNK